MNSILIGKMMQRYLQSLTFIITLVFFSVSCQDDTTYELFTDDSDSDVFIKLATSSSGGRKTLLVSTPEQYGQLVVCLDTKKVCQKQSQSKGQNLTYGDEIKNRHFYALDYNFDFEMLIRSQWVHIISYDGGSAEILRSLTLSPDGIKPIPEIPEEGESGEFKLSMGEVYQQGPTMYCWAYATYFTFRTYFDHAKDDTPEAQAWKDFVDENDSSDGFGGFLRKNIQNYGGNTPRFLKELKEKEGLPTFLKVENGQGRSTLNRVIENLHKGIPTPFCDGQHCTAIYGYETDGDDTPETFIIADSQTNKKDGIVRRTVDDVMNRGFYPYIMSETNSNSENDEDEYETVSYNALGAGMGCTP